MFPRQIKRTPLFAEDCEADILTLAPRVTLGSRGSKKDAAVEKMVDSRSSLNSSPTPRLICPVLEYHADSDQVSESHICTILRSNVIVQRGCTLTEVE